MPLLFYTQFSPITYDFFHQRLLLLGKLTIFETPTFVIRQWMVLCSSAIFLLLSADESSSFHVQMSLLHCTYHVKINIISLYTVMLIHTFYFVVFLYNLLFVCIHYHTCCLCQTCSKYTQTYYGGNDVQSSQQGPTHLTDRSRQNTTS